MIPKKASSLYQLLAEDKNLDPKLVESFVEFYYKNLHSQYRDKLMTLICMRTAIDVLNQKQI
jgi:hypothetical protein